MQTAFPILVVKYLVHFMLWLGVRNQKEDYEIGFYRNLFIGAILNDITFW